MEIKFNTRMWYTEIGWDGVIEVGNQEIYRCNSIDQTLDEEDATHCLVWLFLNRLSEVLEEDC